MVHKGSHLSAEAKDNLRQVNLGKKHSPETIEKIRQANVGKRMPPGAREKMRQAKLGNKYCIGHKCPKKTRDKIRRSLLGHPVSAEARSKMRKARLRHVFPKKMTDIERLLHAEFKKRRLRFEMHKTMFDRWQPDFVFEQARLIVQADGDYWHSMRGRVAHDRAFNADAAENGWSVWRFGGKEIEMHAAACARAVARFVRDHSRISTST